MQPASRFRGPRLFFVLGACCLALANLSRWLAPRLDDFGDGVADGVFGALIGMGIGLLGLALRRRWACKDSPTA